MAETLKIWPIGTDHKVVIRNVRNDAGEFINGGDITAIMKDANGNVVANASLIIFSYIVDSDGDYEAIIPYNADLLEDREYTLHFTAIKDGMRASPKMTRTAATITL